MNVTKESAGSFASYCALNAKFWSEVYPVSIIPHAGIILVDLLHDNAGYLLRSLLIAKYVQQLTGAELVGLSASLVDGKGWCPGVVARSCPAFNSGLNEILARSFGVTEFWRMAPPFEQDRLEAAAWFDRAVAGALAHSSFVPGLRQLLKNWILDDGFPHGFPHGFPLGRFVYDTTIRSELCATISMIDDPLRAVAADCLALYRWVRGQLQKNEFAGRPFYFVTGHLDYNPWGLVGEAVRRHGGDVFYFRPEHRIPLYHIVSDGINAPNTEQTLNAVFHTLETRWFHQVIWPHHQDLAPNLPAFMAGDASRAFYQRWTARNLANLPPDVVQAVVAEWRQQFGWQTGIPVNGVFAHAFADQPLADAQLYDDRFVWLAETLAFAAQHPERNWLIKIHPTDLSYDQSGASKNLMARYASCAHIKFIEGDTPFNIIENLCDVAVTIFGLPGLQMAAAGKPVIVAGNGPYAACGFVHRPASVDAYHHLLLADPATLTPSAEQVERARLFSYAQFLCGKPFSPLLESIVAPPDAAFWEHAGRQLRIHSLLSDDLYLAIRRMLQDKSGYASRPFMERFFWDKDASAVPKGRQGCNISGLK